MLRTSAALMLETCSRISVSACQGSFAEDRLVDPMMIVMPPAQVLVVEGDDVAAR